jgi:alginate O-acetyltransferase complex protein AlgI
LLIVFFLCGLWHGADVTFILWGLWHGLFLIFERLPMGRMLERVPIILSRGYTLIVVLVGWVFFRAENISVAGAYLKDMFTVSFAPVVLTYHTMACAALAAGAVSCLLPDRFFPAPTSHKAGSFPASAYCLQTFLAILSIALLLAGMRNPFIYFDF